MITSRVALVGVPGVGKRALVERFARREVFTPAADAASIDRPYAVAEGRGKVNAEVLVGSKEVKACQVEEVVVDWYGGESGGGDGMSLAKVLGEDLGVTGVLLVFDSGSYESYAALEKMYAAVLLALPSVPGKCLGVVATGFEVQDKEVSAPMFHRIRRVSLWNVVVDTGYNAELPFRFLLRAAASLPYDTSFLLLSMGGQVFFDHTQIGTDEQGSSSSSSKSEEAILASVIRRKRAAGGFGRGKHGTLSRAEALEARPRADPSDDDVVIEFPPPGPLCTCGPDQVPGLYRSAKARPDHPNHGRPYYACSNPDEWSCCDFFFWADLPLASQSSSTRDLCHSVSCRTHGLPTVRRTVFRSSSNRGRVYLACSAPQRCDFFQWEDKPRFKFTRWAPPSARESLENVYATTQMGSEATSSSSITATSGSSLVHAMQEIHRLVYSEVLDKEVGSALVSLLSSPDAAQTAHLIALLESYSLGGGSPRRGGGGGGDQEDLSDLVEDLVNLVS